MPSVNSAPRIIPSTLSDPELKASLEQETKNSVTAAELKPDQPRFTALGVDSTQMSKLYHGTSAPFAFVDSPELSQKDDIQHCRKDVKVTIGPDGKEQKICVGGFRNATVKAVNLSCLYRNEKDGQVYRVLQSSKFFEAPFHKGGTPNMQQKVCGGHVLESANEGGFSTWSPKQKDKAGNTLYLNPEHIIKATPVSPEEKAKFKLP